jgi:hypothetical protein
VTVLALARVAEGGRVVGVEPNTRVGELLVDALDPAPRAELLHILTLPDFEQADRIGLGVDLVYRGRADVRLDGDQMTADADDGDTGHSTETYMPPSSGRVCVNLPDGCS